MFKNIPDFHNQKELLKTLSHFWVIQVWRVGTQNSFWVIHPYPLACLWFNKKCLKSVFACTFAHHTVEYLLCSVVIIVDSPCPVAQMRRKSSFGWGVNFPMTSQVPLANSHRVVSKVVHILRHQLEFRWEAIRCGPVYYVTLQTFFSGNKNGVSNWILWLFIHDTFWAHSALPFWTLLFGA